MLPEHGLDLHAGLLVDPRPDIEGVFNGWKPPPFWIPGLGQETSCGRRVVGKPRRRVVASGSGWRHRGAGSLAHPGDAGGDPGSIQRHGHSAANTGILKGFARGVEADEVLTQVIEAVEVRASGQLRPQLAGDNLPVRNEVYFAVQKQIERSRRIVAAEDVDALGHHLSGIPILGIPAQTEPIVHSPTQELIGTTARQGFGPDPLISQTFHRSARNRKKHPGSRQFQKVGRGVLEVDANRMGIECFGSQLGGIAKFTIHDGSAIPNAEELTRVIGRRSRSDGSSPGPDNLLGFNRFSSGPARLRPQKEQIGQPIAGDFPMRGQPRHGRAIGRIEPRQTFKQCRGDAAIGLPCEDLRIDGLRFRTIVQDQIGPFQWRTTRENPRTHHQNPTERANRKPGPQGFKQPGPPTRATKNPRLADEGILLNQTGDHFAAGAAGAETGAFVAAFVGVMRVLTADAAEEAGAAASERVTASRTALAAEPELFFMLPNQARRMQRPRKTPPVHLVMVVSALPAPAPNRVSTAPEPNAMPMPASFLGSWIRTSRPRRRHTSTRRKLKRPIRIPMILKSWGRS